MLPLRLYNELRDRIKARADVPSLTTIGSITPSSSVRFPSYGGQSGLANYQSQNYQYNTLLNLLYGAYANTRINYAAEVGDLLKSSLLLTPIKWLSRVLPEAPIYLSKQDDDGKEKERLVNHPAVRILNRPNPYYGGKLLWAGFAASWIMDGRCYFRKIRDARGKVAGLLYLPHFRVKACWPQDGTAFISHYEQTTDGMIEKIPVEDIIHFRDGIDPRNEREGLGSTEALLREIYGDNEAANIMADLFRNGGLGGLMISPKQGSDTFSQEPGDATAIADDLLKKTTGDNRFKPRFADGPIDITKTTFNPSELDLSNSRRFPEERLAALLPGNGYVLGFGAHMQHPTYNNVETARKDAYQSSLVPLLAYIEDELDAQYLVRWDNGKSVSEFDEDVSNLTFEHDYSKVLALQEDRTQQRKDAGYLYKMGVIDRWKAKQMAGDTPEDSDKGVYGNINIRVSGDSPTAIAEEIGGPKRNGHRQMKAKPSESEIDEAVSWWQATQDPSGAALINARTN